MAEAPTLTDPIDIRIQVLRAAPNRIRVSALDGSGTFIADREDPLFAPVTDTDHTVATIQGPRAIVFGWPEHHVQMSRADFVAYCSSMPESDIPQTSTDAGR
jgi:hypothetical protein